MAPTLLIVDDHAAFRSTARALLECDGWNVIGEAGDGTSGLSAARDLKPPLYEVVSRTGAHHAPQFTIRVSVPKLGEATADGASKQEAETAAAAALLSQVK